LVSQFSWRAWAERTPCKGAFRGQPIAVRERACKPSLPCARLPLAGLIFRFGMGLTRSEQMARIRSRDTKPEWILRRELHRRGLRYRVALRVEGCRPDIVFPSKRLAVFVDGCFWHGCPDHYIRPKSSVAFWDEKLRVNRKRDAAQTSRLEAAGWTVVRLWEHEVTASPEKAADRIEALVQARR